MASATILNNAAPYYTIRVSCSFGEFDQTIVSDKTGKDLDAVLQSYADDYESALAAAEEASG